MISKAKKYYTVDINRLKNIWSQFGVNYLKQNNKNNKYNTKNYTFI